VATTNALELGVDIGAGRRGRGRFPGTRASFWQQAGRAGRGRDEALVVLVARDDPLDTYLVHHPDALLGTPVEGCVLDPANPYVLAPHLACAAAELPLTEADIDLLGGPAAAAVLAELVADGVLRRRPTGWFWPSSAHGPAGSVDLRGAGQGQVAVVEVDTGRMLGTVEGAAAPASVHPGAVYLHRGESYVVDDLDLDARLALVHAAVPDWRTDARSTADVAVMRVAEHRDHGAVRVSFGEVSVTTQVTAYQRRTPDGVVLETVPLDMPAHTLATRASLYDVDDAALLGAGVRRRIPGALHAAEHAAIGLLPLFATCDRWDIGGCRRSSTRTPAARPSSSTTATRAAPGSRARPRRARAPAHGHPRGDRRLRVSGGCPSCVQSPKCGNGNVPLDKAGAVTVLDVVLEAVSGPS
jgi:DEAD/DEAH box helicase domain-containing protein